MSCLCVQSDAAQSKLEQLQSELQARDEALEKSNKENARLKAALRLLTD